MSEHKKKKKVIHVENLVIHAENVDFIRERPHRERERKRERDVHERDPWGFFWGRSRGRHEEVLEEGELKSED